MIAVVSVAELRLAPTAGFPLGVHAARVLHELRHGRVDLLRRDPCLIRQIMRNPVPEQNIAWHPMPLETRPWGRSRKCAVGCRRQWSRTAKSRPRPHDIEVESGMLQIMPHNLTAALRLVESGSVRAVARRIMTDGTVWRSCGAVGLHRDQRTCLGQRRLVDHHRSLRRQGDTDAAARARWAIR